MASPVLVQRLDALLPAAADPVRAVSARAYMRDQFEFFGIPSPRLRELARAARVGLDRPTETDLVAVARECWARPQREYQYVACDYLRRYVTVASADFLNPARELIIAKSWWDTVDTLASHTVGALVAQHPELKSTMDEGAVDQNLWLARTAILHQLRYRADTDTDRLFGYCTGQAAHRDFFIRKAIGWALREYAKTDPAAVREYVQAHRGELSGLSVREALKNL